jgi:hypothetical protein
VQELSGRKEREQAGGAEGAHDLRAAAVARRFGSDSIRELTPPVTVGLISIRPQVRSAIADLRARASALLTLPCAPALLLRVSAV